MVKNILFICKYNRFRSRIAEDYFKRNCKDKKIKVKSRGIIKGDYPLDKEEVFVARQLGIRLVGKPKTLDIPVLNWADKIIIVADNVPTDIFKKSQIKKVEQWKIKDISSRDNRKVIKQRILLITKQVDRFIQRLKWKQ